MVRHFHVRHFQRMSSEFLYKNISVLNGQDNLLPAGRITRLVHPFVCLLFVCRLWATE